MSSVPDITLLCFYALILLFPLGCSTSDGELANDARMPQGTEASTISTLPDASSLKTESAPPYTHEEVSPQTVNQWLSANTPLTLIDVREAAEYSGGHIAQAINLPWTSGILARDYATLAQDKPIVVNCQSGSRSHAAAKFLVEKGLRPLYDLQGGILAWTSAGLPVQ